MIRAGLVLFVAGVAGFWVTGILFSLVLPLVWLALKVGFFVGIVYLIVRLVNPEYADKLKEKCCGGRAVKS
ncbi:hypothetical protein [Candidatus Palauibacter sp.]|uniref:hypothetical protein n=1 Tax=Candidatus Palauibacter sp. TaxID=3101350 RepID=UPI003AF27716